MKLSVPSILATYLFGLFSMTGIIYVASCTPGGRAAAIATGLDVALCVAENLEQPKDVVLAKCLRENVTKEDVEKMLSAQQKATDAAVARQLAARRGASDGGAGVVVVDAGVVVEAGRDVGR